MPEPSIFTSDTPLDPGLYSLDPAALEFFKQQTGITEDDELKQPHPCCSSKGFRVGNDARKVVADGWPATQVISTDIKQEFWDLGHVLFRSTPTSFPSHFISGNCLDPAFLSSEPGPTSQSLPDLSSLTSLNDLRGKLTVIHAASIFHLFSQEEQASLVRAVASLLSPAPGSIAFGSHVGLPKQGTIRAKVPSMGVEMYCYDPESWNKLWEDAGPFKTEAVLREVIDPNGEIGWMMVWSATMSTKSSL
ncbi:hypothetical protein DEU56DRAFT_758327 [Suillus clintonianus]|uniref:uncharacterized protein n=1 Tax=Suillus clintonianus TaxID=1904413 RepID=UPI001B8807DE|nr:uncharacterized protein DEU56DRAFT_758327 [Suillus clintonianus]KAG2128705.1 hypothetical protein DEU56DRAFT_758327 [Suillus clintonianus]